MRGTPTKKLVTATHRQVVVLSTLVIVGISALIAPVSASAQVPGYTDCSKGVAVDQLKAAGVYRKLDEAYVIDPGTQRSEQVFFVQQSFCRDLTGDGRPELVALLNCCTVSSPTPWAILTRGADGQPLAAFLAIKPNYVRKLRIVSYKGRPVVLERRSTVTRYDANCCPTGDPRVRKVGVNSAGHFATLRAYRVAYTGVRACGTYGHAAFGGPAVSEIRVARATCKSARGLARRVVRGIYRSSARRIIRANGWRCVRGRTRQFQLRYSCRRRTSRARIAVPLD